MRLAYNLPLGLLLGWALYQLAWHRLDFGDFHPLFAQLFRALLILGSGLAFALSPVSAMRGECGFCILARASGAWIQTVSAIVSLVMVLLMVLKSADS